MHPRKNPRDMINNFFYKQYLEQYLHMTSWLGSNFNFKMKRHRKRSSKPDLHYIMISRGKPYYLLQRV